MSNQKELKMQQDCYKFFHNHYREHRGKLWRVENERRRSKYEQMIAKSTGLVAGVSDLNLVHQGTFYAIELKTETGRQSKSQKKWQKIIESEGGQYHIVRSLEEFQELIREVIGE